MVEFASEDCFVFEGDEVDRVAHIDLLPLLNVPRYACYLVLIEYDLLFLEQNSYYLTLPPFFPFAVFRFVPFPEHHDALR